MNRLLEGNTYKYESLNGNGDPLRPMQLLSYREVRVRVAFECPEYPLASLNHMLAIAHAHAHPVELVQFNKEKSALLWTARITLLRGNVELAI